MRVSTCYKIKRLAGRRRLPGRTRRRTGHRPWRQRLSECLSPQRIGPGTSPTSMRNSPKPGNGTTPSAASRPGQAVRTGTRATPRRTGRADRTGIRWPGEPTAAEPPWPSYPPSAARCALARIAASVSAGCSPGAELDELRARLGRGDVPRRHVEGVARLVGLLAVGVPDGDRPGQQVAPVRALAAVSGQAAQQRGQRVAVPDGHEADRGVVQVAAPVDRRAASWTFGVLSC